MQSIHVTEAESAILEALWRYGPLSPTRLVAAVKATRPWGDATIKTLLGRLRQKKAVRSEREDGLLRYRATIERSAYIEAELRTLVARFFDNDASAFAAFVTERIGTKAISK